MKEALKRGPGRPSRGPTHMVNIKLRSSVALRLYLAGQGGKSQREITETLLDVALPPLPALETIPVEILTRYEMG